MMHTLRIKGDNNRPVVTISVDDGEKEFDLSEDISAESIYAVLNYRRGDRYSVELGESGSIDNAAFEAFCGLLERVAEKINEYAEEIEETEEIPTE